MRTALLAAVSHDLRTPLASVKAGVSSLRQNDVAWSPLDRDELVLSIAEGAERLEHIIGNLLDMTRVSTGTVQPLLRPTAVEEVLLPAVRAVQPERLHIDVPEDLPMVSADPGLLERVLDNLVANAVRFSPPDRQVVVSTRTTADAVVIDVVDHGPGVAPPRRNDMFVPFQRLDDRGPTGVGLGLAVARGFIEAMGGSIAAESTPGGGLTMRLRLPMALAEAAAAR
jgi:two-component system sensor histidine kinase KdpD